MIDGVAIGEVRPGYELWRPNREKAESVTTKFVIAFLLAATAFIAALVTIAGFSLLSGGGGMGIVCLIFAALYALFAFLVARWSRGILPVAAALSMILAIFCAVGADSWFARDKAGFEEAMLPSSLIGLLVVILVLLQIIVDRGGPLRLQPELARRGGAPDRLRRGLRRRRPARERRPAARLSLRASFYAGGGTRTHKPFRAIDFESIAYSNSATPARCER